MALRNSENRQKREGTPTKITISCNYTCVKGGGGGWVVVNSALSSQNMDAQ